MHTKYPSINSRNLDVHCKIIMDVVQYFLFHLSNHQKSKNMPCLIPSMHPNAEILPFHQLRNNPIFPSANVTIVTVPKGNKKEKVFHLQSPPCSNPKDNNENIIPSYLAASQAMGYNHICPFLPNFLSSSSFSVKGV